MGYYSVLKKKKKTKKHKIDVHLRQRLLFPEPKLVLLLFFPNPHKSSVRSA